VAGSGEHGNEPSSSIKEGEFLDKLSDYQLQRTLRHGVSLIDGRFQLQIMGRRFCVGVAACFLKPTLH
jgi:hypothetical protein